MTDAPDTSVDRPLITFALFAYNQEKYIRDAVKGAFSQTYEPLEIILSDDCSSDRTFEIMQEMVEVYDGPHKIIVKSNQRNTGLAAHINNVVESANGNLIVVAAGDDISIPERTAHLVNYWIQNGKFSGSLYSFFRAMDENGELLPAHIRRPSFQVSLKDRDISMLNNFSGLSGCSHAWTKDVFEIFGSLDVNIQHEDVSIPLRSLLIGSIGFLPLDLVYYRLTSGSITRKKFKNSSDRFRQMQRYWNGRVMIFRQFEADFEKVYLNNNEKMEDLKWIKNKTEIGKKHARQQWLLYCKGPIYRLLVCLNPYSPLRIRDRAKWIILSFIPSLYARL